MGVPYKLQRRRNPQKPDEPGQWHAVPKTGKAVDEKIMTRMATDDTTMADFELSSAAKLIGKFIHNQTIQGKRVRIPGLGSFRVSFGSEGVDDITKFNTNMIRNVKVVFVMDSDLRPARLHPERPVVRERGRGRRGRTIRFVGELQRGEGPDLRRRFHSVRAGW